MIRIKAPQQKIHEGVDVSQDLSSVLSGSFVYCVLGRPGSGKSYLIEQLLSDKRFYSEKFDHILYVGPINYSSVEHNTQNTVASLDIGFITNRLKDFLDEPQPVHVLLVMDDVVSELSQMRGSQVLKSLFFNRRHLMKQGGSVSIIITSQRYSVIPQFVRSCLTGMFVFRLISGDIKSLVNQAPIRKSKNLISGMLQAMGQHEFVFFNLLSGRAFNDSFVQC